MRCPLCHKENAPDSRYCRYCAASFASAGEADARSGYPGREQGRELQPGVRTAGKYAITRKIGEGGMGVVYEAEDLRLARRVALKFLSPERTRALDYKERFIREARASSGLDHPNICTIYEIGEDEDERLFIAMSFCPGESLKQKLMRGPLDVPEGLDLAVQVSRGLACAHAQGIIHRDVKPGNIMESEGREVKIVDFGLAKFAEDTDVTRTAGLTGTLAYMSPEQIQGEPLDAKTDLWSLGVVMYEMFTGVHPFPAETAQSLVYAVLNRSPVAPSEINEAVPARLEEIILRCLVKDRRHRYPSAKDLVSELSALGRARGAGGAPPAPVPRGRPVPKKETEQRQATVLFAEIEGVRELVETVEPRKAADLLERCRASFDFIETDYGGRVDRITDSSFRAVFGFPSAIEDAPAKAAQAALDLKKAFDELSRSEALGTPLRPAIGIQSGTVIAGVLGGGDRPEFMIVGETVTLASQLKDLSEQGAVIVGPAMVRKTEETFAYRPLKPVAVKGRDRPLEVFELVAAKERAARRRFGQERIISSDLVGRMRELDRLQLQVLKAVNGEGSIVNLVGEAGVGKSALISTLKAVPAMSRVRLVEGSALAIGKNLSFHPLIDMLKNWAGIGEDDGPAESVGKLEKATRALGPDGLEEIFPFVATLMGFSVAGRPAERLKGIEGEALEKLILKSLRELLQKTARARPLVVILEDLHWADLTSIRFLESVFRLAEDNPILFLNVFRPGYQETGGRLFDAVRARYGRIAVDIALEPLSRAESETLISNLLKLGAVPAAARSLIVERTEGNPFFIEEVLRSFIDDGVIEIKDGAFLVTDRIHAAIIPETVQELLMVRIDRLDEGSRSLLKVAAVIGRSFLRSVLAAVADSGPGIELQLDELKDSQLIRERQSGDEIEGLFKHALVQEVAYESILPAKRREIHRRIAQAIESLYAARISEFYGMLAFHFSKAEDLEKSEAYLVKAGEEALRSSASDEALHYYGEALKIYLAKSGRTADPERIAMLRKNIGIALFDRGRLYEAIDHFEAAMNLYGERKPRGTVAQAVRFAAGFLNFVLSLYVPGVKFRKVPTEREQAAIDLYKRKMTALAVTMPKRMFIESFIFSRLLVRYDMTRVENGLGILAGYSAIFCWPGMSFTLSRKILQIVAGKLDPDVPKPWIYFRFSEVIHRFLKGEWDRIPPCDEELVERSLKIGEFFYTTTYLDINCHFQLERGRLDLAERSLGRIREIATTYDYDYAQDEYHFLRTLLLLKRRRIPEALAEAEEGLTFAKQRSYTTDVFSLLAFKARAQVLLGDLDGADKTLHELDSGLTKENIVPLYLSWCLASHFLLDLARIGGQSAAGAAGGRAGRARQAQRTARKMLRNSRKAASERTEVRRLRGLLEWTRGRRRQALRWWEKSVDQAGRLGASLELAWTYREAGTRLRGEAGPPLALGGLQADELLAKAEDLIRDMECPPPSARSRSEGPGGA